MKKVFTIPLVVAVVFFVAMAAVKIVWPDLWGTLLGGGPALSYKAVFLANGQVYFGKISRTESSTITLTDVFYLKAKTVDPRDLKQATAAAQMELVKPGGEIYGPKDTLIINRRQILVIQDLKDDSPVVKGIARYYQTLSPTPAKSASNKGKVEVKSE